MEIARKRIDRAEKKTSNPLPEKKENAEAHGQPLVGNSSESTAREKWNANADGFNQWNSLGQDEKDELIANINKEQPLQIEFED